MLKQMIEAINTSAFSEFLQRRFPGAKTSSGTRHLSEVALLAERYGYEEEFALDMLLRRTEFARSALNRAEPIPNAAGHIACAIGLEKPDCREESRWRPSTRLLLHKYATVR